jgi:hypothetical protein
MRKCLKSLKSFISKVSLSIGIAGVQECDATGDAIEKTKPGS